MRIISTLAFALLAAAALSAQTPPAIPAPPDVAAAPADAAKTASGLASKVLHPAPEDSHGGRDRSPSTTRAGRRTARCSTARSRAASRPAFPLDRVIAGWTEGVQLMVAGEKRRFWIPGSARLQGQRRSAEGHARLRRRADRHRRRRAPADVKAPPADAKKTPAASRTR